MRRKKHLEERLRACEDIIISMYGEDKNFITGVEKKEYIDLEKLFGNNNPLYLEVGCGKGKFAAELARRNPDKNILAVEKESNVIVCAAELAQEQNLKNLKFLLGPAELLPKFLKDDSVDRIYLNFSCPFPKKRYASHRLTHRSFLKIYKGIMKQGAEIHQKTDNPRFFEFSIEQLSQSGFALKNVTFDLYSTDFEDNIPTEYEERFISQGLNIYRLEAYLNTEE
ncbi:MAG: tRNA (guanosine(46)-N7)-methyltransferase TrmB [Ruminococcus sp.]|nr:tRNA (guanosine(46)-N7)-methyltransferase TrmB [Ruminococcus sp.]